MLKKRENNKEIQKTMQFGGAKSQADRLNWKFKRMPPTDSVVVPSKCGSDIFSILVLVLSVLI